MPNEGLECQIFKNTITMNQSSIMLNI